MDSGTPAPADRPGVPPPRRGLRLLVTLCALLLAADLLDLAGVLYHRHGHYSVEEWFGFYAALGLASAGLALIAGRLGRLLRSRGDAENA